MAQLLGKVRLQRLRDDWFTLCVRFNNLQKIRYLMQIVQTLIRRRVVWCLIWV